MFQLIYLIFKRSDGNTGIVSVPGSIRRAADHDEYVNVLICTAGRDNGIDGQNQRLVYQELSGQLIIDYCSEVLVVDSTEYYKATRKSFVRDDDGTDAESTIVINVLRGQCSCAY